MEKPVVFLSHSTKDKRQIVALKELLDKQTVGAIDFFLSSDGESIPLGTSWIHRIVDALDNSKLMFVFVSQESLKSGWIFFEAGHSFGRKMHVVPCCLPGVELKHLPAPLSLLQAQTLHSAADINRLLAKCNQVFSLKVPERTAKGNFEAIFKGNAVNDSSTKILIVPWHKFVSEITIECEGPPDGLMRFLSICRRRKLNAFFETLYGEKPNKLNGAGISIIEQDQWFDDLENKQVFGTVEKGAKNETRKYSFVFNPELFHLTAPVFDSW